MMPDTLDSNSSQKYQIRFFYDWHCDSPFWAANEIAYAKFDVGPIDPEALGLSVELSKRLRDMSEWHDTALNWDSPADPLLWRQEECDRFNAAIDNLLEIIRSELTEEFEIIDEQVRYSEDPDLDEYLANPDTFHIDRQKRYAS